MAEDQRVSEIARIIDPVAFEPTSGFGHAEFAAEDRDDRERAREKARQILAALAPPTQPDPPAVPGHVGAPTEPWDDSAPRIRTVGDAQAEQSA